jgi:alpha-L-rhamnosidase
MNKIILSIIAFLFSIEVFCQVNHHAVHLKVNNSTAPLGINTKLPSFSWQLHSTKRNTVQTSYHILVSDKEENLKNNIGNTWNSGEVKSSQSIQIKYSGKALQPSTTYYWKVKVQDTQQGAGEWSETATFQTGLFNKEDWKKAQWIAYEKLADEYIDVLPKDTKKDAYSGSNVLPLLRKDFKVKKQLARATMFISGLGHFDMSLNGKKQGDHFMDAGWVKYDKEALYVTFDVTGSLNKGNNTIGVMLGNGFYYVPPVRGRFRKSKPAFGMPKMICRLVLEYKDGSTEDIISDGSWNTAKSPITFSSIYGGEDYDARLEQKGWDTPKFNAASWKSAMVVDGPPLLRPQDAEPLKIFENFSPVAITKAGDKQWIYDLGQNASGIISLKVKGNKGDTIRVYPGELLKDGLVTQKASGGPFFFEYVLKGEGEETWQPRFTYYGFRYLELRGAVPAGKSEGVKSPEVMEIKGLHIRNAAPRVSEFSSSSELINKTHQLIDWAIKSNMMSVFTDCPHREKLGWLEQSHLMISSVMYNYDVATLTNKVVDDVISSQLDNGLIPEIAPEYIQFTWGGEMFRDSPEWGSTGIILPWYMYKWYGNVDVLAKAYPTMQRYIAYLQTKAENNILKQGLGDWYDIGPERPGVSQQTTMGVTGTAIYYYNLQILQKIAKMLAKPDDAIKYQKLAEEVKASFNKTFFNPNTKQYATGSQAANAMAIYMKLVAPEHKQAVIANLIKDIRDRNNALTAGDIGYRYVLRVLEAEGRSDVIFDMNNRDDVPGYGYQLAKGATALTESWQALPSVSNNHLMLGHLMEWFYSGLAGIRAEEDAVAYDKIKIYPEPVGDVKSAKATYNSSYGLISSDWKIVGDVFEIQVEIPANTTATIYLPAKSGKQITESGKSIHGQMEGGRYVVKTGSGSYNFKVQ